MALLPPPYLPQAMLDNLICHTEVESLPGVVVIIRPYELAARGDLIRLYWNDVFRSEMIIADDDISNSLPWVVIIDKASVNFGENKIRYTATDAYDNFNQSDNMRLFILQNCAATLPPPQFTDSVDGVISEVSIINNQGTHLAIPSYSNIREDDEINITFTGYTNEGEFIPAAQYTIQHFVESSDISNGFSVLVPLYNLLTIRVGEARASYSVVRTGSGNIEYSDSSSASITAVSTLLPAPIFDDAMNGLLDSQAISSGINVSVLLAPSIDIELGDTVTLTWRGYNYFGELINGTEGNITKLPLTISDLSAGVLKFVISSEITVFSHIIYLRCEYVVTNVNTNKYRLSNPATALIDVNGRVIPAPVFPSAVNNIITQESVINNNGTLLLAIYTGIAIGDIVSFSINGTDESGNPEPTAKYNSTIVVNSTHILSNSVGIQIPADKLLAVGNGGSISAEYQVVFSGAPGGFASSLKSSVLLQTETRWLLSELVVDNNAEANGIMKNYILYTLRNSFNSPVEGVYLRFSADQPGVNLDTSAAPTTAAGQYILGLTATNSGPASVRAEVLSDPTIFAVSSVLFTDKGVELIAETLIDNSPSNGMSLNRVLFTLRERLTGLRIPDVYLNITTSNGAIPESLVQKTDANGYVELMITNTITGNVWIDARSLYPYASTTKVVTFL